MPISQMMPFSGGRTERNAIISQMAFALSAFFSKRLTIKLTTMATTRVANTTANACSIQS